MAVFPSAQFKPAANIETPEQKKQKKLLLIFALVILVIIVVIYFGFSSPKEPSAPAGEESAGATASQQEIPSLEGISFDFSVFNDQRFSALTDFSSGIDISSVEKGRRNPFK